MSDFILAIFLLFFGFKFNQLGFELARASGLKKYIAKINFNPRKAMLIGFILTTILQSSSLLAVMAINLVNAGFLSALIAFYILLGANLGTTMTVQFISLTTDKFIIILLILAIVALILSKKHKNFLISGIILLSLFLILAAFRSFGNFFYRADINLFLQSVLKRLDGELIPALFTGFLTTSIFQSSSLISSLVVSLGKANLIELITGIAIIVGSNLGTSITAILASINGNKVAKNLALADFMFNLYGLIIFYFSKDLFYKFVLIFSSDHLHRQLAMSHFYFNIFNIILFLPVLIIYSKYRRVNKVE